METTYMNYFSSLNPLCKKIVKDELLLKEAIGNEAWESFDWRQREELLDDFFVDSSSRERYAEIEKSDSYPPSFPKLHIESGEKIIVDFEKDCWTWQDEHSSPFCWKSKSQQDLTLDDLDPEVLSKPPSKQKVKKEEIQSKEETAPREFAVQEGKSIWESPFLAGMKKPEHLSRNGTSTSMSSSTSKISEKLPQEVNYGFNGGSRELNASSSSHSLSDSAGSLDSNKRRSLPRKRSFSKSPSKSPSRSISSKLSLSSSFSKKSDLQGDHKSLFKKEQEQEIQAFENPGLDDNEFDSYTSSFVNKSEESLSSATSSPSHKLLNEADDELSAAGGKAGDFGYQEVKLMAAGTAEEDSLQSAPSPVEEKPASIPKTGFDFLDAW